MMIKNSAVFLLLLVVASIGYSNSLSASFQYDDFARIVENKDIQINDFDLPSVKKLLNGFRPVALLSFAMNYRIGGLDVIGYHLVNIFIHVLAAFGLYLFSMLSLSILREREGRSEESRLRYENYSDGRILIISVLAALIWLTNPLQIQAVTYIVQRMASMAAMFYVYSIYFYARGRLSTGSKGVIFYIFCLICSVLAFGSKESSIMLPLIIIGYEIFIIRKMDLSALRSRRTLLPLSIVSFAAFLLISYLLWEYAGQYFRLYTGGGSIIMERLFTEARVLFIYLSLFFFPLASRLNLEHDIQFSYSISSPFMTFPAVIGVLIIVFFIFFLARKRQLTSFMLVWALCNLAPESLYISITPIYEHRTYLPFMGIALIFSEELVNTGLNKNNKFLITASFLIVCLFSINTYRRNLVWKEELTLWSDTVDKSPYSSVANTGLGITHLRKGRLTAAIEMLEKATQTDPFNPFIRYYLGLALYKCKMYDRAETELRRVWKKGLDNPPGQPSIDLLFYDMALYYMNKGNSEKAQRLLEEASFYHPENERLLILKKELD